MEAYADGTTIVFVVPVSRKDPEKQLRRAVTKVYGQKFEILDPKTNRSAYDKAYEIVRARLRKDEHLVVIDPNTASVSLHTPKREHRAWSAWIRVVDISQALYN